MGWSTVRRLISGYIATAMAGPRIIISGQDGAPGKIEMYSADPLETSPAAVQIVPFLSTLSYLVMTSPEFTGGEISKLELWTDGTAKLVARNGMIIDWDLRILQGDLAIENGGIYVSGSGGIGGFLNVGGNIETTGGNVNISPDGQLNIGDRAGPAINAGGDVNVNAGGNVNLNGGGNVLVNGGAIEVTGGNVSVVDGDIVLAAGRIFRGGAWPLQFTPGGLKAGWTQFGGGYEPAAIIQNADYFAEYTGTIQAGTTAGGTTIHTLPTWLRPGGHHVFSQPTSGGGSIQMVVRSDGDLRIQGGFTSGTWISLDGMRWPIAGFG